MTLIKVDSLGISLANKLVLKDLSFSIQDGEFICLVGPNGAGKTTLIRSLIGLLDYSGEIRFRGKELSEYSRKQIAKHFSYVPQRLENIPDFSVLQFVSMSRYPHLSWHTQFSSRDHERVREALSIANLEELSERKLTELSGGELQRVLIASALCQETEILLLDEPTSFLDPHQEVHVYQLLARLHQELGKTIIIVTHDLNRAAVSTERIIGMNRGEIFFDGAPREFMKDTVLKPIYGQAFHFVPHPESETRMTLPRGGMRST